MKLIDTHTHTWGRDTAELPWVADVLPPGWEGPYTHRDLVADMDRVGIMDFYPADGDIRERFRRVVGHERMLGVRMHAAMEYAEIPTELNRTGDWILEDTLAPVFEEAAAQNVAIFVFPKAEQLPYIAEIADDHPGADIVVDHMGWPDDTTHPDEAPWAAFEAVARRPNVYVKVSSLPRSADRDWPYEDLQGYVRNLLDWFGPERLMVGSDYPWMDSWADYGDCLSWIDAADFLSRRDRAYLSYRTFRELHL